MNMNYWLLKTEIRSGEYTFYDLSLHTTTKGKFDAHAYLADFYPDAEPEEDGWFSTDCCSVMWAEYDLKKITKREYAVLRKLL